MGHTVDIQVRERENAETPVSRPAGTEVWVMLGVGTVQFDLQHSERDLRGQRDAGSNPDCLIKCCCAVSIQGDAAHISKEKRKQLWVMVQVRQSGGAGRRLLLCVGRSGSR